MAFLKHMSKAKSQQNTRNRATLYSRLATNMIVGKGRWRALNMIQLVNFRSVFSQEQQSQQKTEEVGFLFTFWYLIHRFQRQNGAIAPKRINVCMKKVNRERNRGEDERL